METIDYKTRDDQLNMQFLSNIFASSNHNLLISKKQNDHQQQQQERLLPKAQLSIFISQKTVLTLECLILPHFHFLLPDTKTTTLKHTTTRWLVVELCGMF